MVVDCSIGSVLLSQLLKPCSGFLQLPMYTRKSSLFLLDINKWQRIWRQLDPALSFGIQLFLASKLLPHSFDFRGNVQKYLVGVDSVQLNRLLCVLRHLLLLDRAEGSIQDHFCFSPEIHRATSRRLSRIAFRLLKTIMSSEFLPRCPLRWFIRVLSESCSLQSAQTCAIVPLKYRWSTIPSLYKRTVTAAPFHRTGPLCEVTFHWELLVNQVTGPAGKPVSRVAIQRHFIFKRGPFHRGSWSGCRRTCGYKWDL